DTAHWVVSRSFHYLPCFHLRPAKNSRPHQSHLQRQCRRIVRRSARCSRRGSQSSDGMDRDSTFHDAKRLYLESCGDPMVTNTYLKIALALLSIVCVALALIALSTIGTFHNFR